MTRLTDSDRRIMAQARELIMLCGMAGIREHTGSSDSTVALTAVIGEAKYLLASLTAIVTRMDEAGEDGSDE